MKKIPENFSLSLTYRAGQFSKSNLVPTLFRHGFSFIVLPFQQRCADTATYYHINIVCHFSKLVYNNVFYYLDLTPDYSGIVPFEQRSLRGDSSYFHSSFSPISSPCGGALTLWGQLPNPAGQSPNPI